MADQREVDLDARLAQGEQMIETTLAVAELVPHVDSHEERLEAAERRVEATEKDLEELKRKSYMLDRVVQHNREVLHNGVKVGRRSSGAS